MKTNMMKTGVAVLAMGICIFCADLRAQTTTTTVTTTRGAFTEFVPNSDTIVMRSDASTTPLRYVVTKQTTVVDESGALVPIQQITPGSALTVDYTGTGDRLVASRIVVQRPTATTTVTGPVTTAPVTEQHTTTTTTTTRPLTHDEKEALKDAKEARKERMEKQIDREKDALEKAKDKLEDGDDH